MNKLYQLKTCCSTTRMVLCDECAANHPSKDKLHKVPGQAAVPCDRCKKS